MNISTISLATARPRFSAATPGSKPLDGDEPNFDAIIGMLSKARRNFRPDSESPPVDPKLIDGFINKRLKREQLDKVNAHISNYRPWQEAYSEMLQMQYNAHLKKPHVRLLNFIRDTLIPKLIRRPLT